MTRLYHPQWQRNNGDPGGPVFKDWCCELEVYGAKGVLQGIQAVRNIGSAYAPTLNKFMSLCRDGDNEPQQSYVNAGSWHTCPYTGRRRRVKDVTAMNPRLDEHGRFIDDPRSDEQIRQDIERMLTAGAVQNLLVDGQAMQELEQ